MMKKTKLLLLPLVGVMALGLAACAPVEEHTVTFDLNYVDATPIVKTVKDGEKVARPSEDPTRVGYTFKNWFDSVSETANLFNFNLAITKDVTVYAHWEAAVDPTIEHSVTFKLNYEGAPADTVVKIKDGEKVAPLTPAPTRDGYDFKLWSLDPVNPVDEYDFTSKVSADFNLYAHWDKIAPVAWEPELSETMITRFGEEMPYHNMGAPYVWEYSTEYNDLVIFTEEQTEVTGEDVVAYLLTKGFKMAETTGWNTEKTNYYVSLYKDAEIGKTQPQFAEAAFFIEVHFGAILENSEAGDTYLGFIIYLADNSSAAIKAHLDSFANAMTGATNISFPEIPFADYGFRFLGGSNNPYYPFAAVDFFDMSDAALQNFANGLSAMGFVYFAAYDEPSAGQYVLPRAGTKSNGDVMDLFLEINNDGSQKGLYMYSDISNVPANLTWPTEGLAEYFGEGVLPKPNGLQNVLLDIFDYSQYGEQKVALSFRGETNTLISFSQDYIAQILASSPKWIQESTTETKITLVYGDNEVLIEIESIASQLMPCIRFTVSVPKEENTFAAGLKLLEDITGVDLSDLPALAGSENAIFTYLAPLYDDDPEAIVTEDLGQVDVDAYRAALVNAGYVAREQTVSWLKYMGDLYHLEGTDYDVVVFNMEGFVVGIYAAGGVPVEPLDFAGAVALLEDLTGFDLTTLPTIPGSENAEFELLSKWYPEDPEGVMSADLGQDAVNAYFEVLLAAGFTVVKTEYYDYYHLEGTEYDVVVYDMDGLVLLIHPTSVTEGGEEEDAFADIIAQIETHTGLDLSDLIAPDSTIATGYHYTPSYNLESPTVSSEILVDGYTQEQVDAYLAALIQAGFTESEIAFGPSYSITAYLSPDGTYKVDVQEWEGLSISIYPVL